MNETPLVDKDAFPGYYLNKDEAQSFAWLLHSFLYHENSRICVRVYNKYVSMMLRLKENGFDLAGVDYDTFTYKLTVDNDDDFG